MFILVLFCIFFLFFRCLFTSFLRCFFFFNDTSTTEIYTLSLHDALPISPWRRTATEPTGSAPSRSTSTRRDRKSTRLNSSHRCNSYAVFCLKKKNKDPDNQHNNREKSSQRQERISILKT